MEQTEKLADDVDRDTFDGVFGRGIVFQKAIKNTERLDFPTRFDNRVGSISGGRCGWKSNDRSSYAIDRRHSEGGREFGGRGGGEIGGRTVSHRASGIYMSG